jgi:hypothetical protein
MPGSRLTESILENIESGRKADLNISQLLSIARALRVPPIYLLSPITSPGARLDLPNLSDDVAAMTAAEFDSWLAAIPSSSYTSATADERIEVDQLNAFRERQTLLRELSRLHVMQSIEMSDADIPVIGRSTEQRIASLQADLQKIDEYLSHSRWELDPFRPFNGGGTQP